MILASNTARRLFGVAACLVAINIGLSILASGFIRKHLTSTLKDECPHCTLDIGSVDFSLLNGALSLKQVQFHFGWPDSLEIKANVPEIKTTVALLKSANGPLLIDTINFSSPQVTIIEGNKSSPSLSLDKPAGNNAEDVTERRTFDVSGLRVKNGTFVYQRAGIPRLATISLYQIEGAANRFGSTAELKAKPLHAELSMILEHTGKAHLKIDTRPAEPHLSVSLGVRLRSQQLADTNQYFDPKEGIKLSGVLEDGEAKVEILGATSTSWLKAKYHGLNVAIESTKDRGAVPAFLQNILAKSKIKPVRDGEKIEHSKREPEESFFTFIFRGLKDVALKLATSSS